MRILIAEDDMASRLILSEIMMQLGHDVLMAENGQDAWAIFKDGHVPLVITDWMMPDVDGIELTRRIRAERRDRYTYVIFLTALGGKDDYLEAMTAGADDFASKPLDAEQLRARVRVAERVLGLQRELVRLELNQQQLVQQERLRALGEMAAGIAHDFGNALSVVLGFSELLLARPEQLADPGRVRQRLELIRTAGRDASQLVGRLRDFYRPREEAEVMVPLDLNEVARTAIALTKPRWKAQAQADGTRVDVETAFDALPFVDGSASELRDVLMNLIFNAVDAMPHGGRLRIATAVDAAASTVRLTVADDGIGMTADVRRRCLEPYFTTKGARGTGLGLAMSYGSVTRHQGSIEVASEPGRGTTVSIRLPASTRRPAPTPEPSGDAERAPRRVLVVDDDPVPRQMVAESLMSDGHVVETATNGRQAFERFARGRFDVVVTDRAMPEMNGVELVAAIVDLARARPGVIMLSGFGHHGPPDALPPGVDVVLAKPVALEQLRQALRRLP